MISEAMVDKIVRLIAVKDVNHISLSGFNMTIPGKHFKLLYFWYLTELTRLDITLQYARAVIKL